MDITNIDTGRIFEILDSTFGQVKPFLNHSNSYELLVAVILSAQTTDALVNKVTPELFAQYSSVYDLSRANISDVSLLINRVNYYQTKARHIVETAKIIVENYNSVVPRTMKELLILPGVGRKVANVIMADVYGVAEGICVDTHVKRVSYRIGWTSELDPAGVEKDLMNIWQHDRWVNTPKQIILIGRNFCFANKKPDCERCPLRDVCKKRIY